jgi:hypothetical protein
MQDATSPVREEEVLAESITSEKAGDRAREDGNWLWALANYRRAAELRPDDPELAAKIAATAAARKQAGRDRAVAPREVRGTTSVSSILALVTSAILTAANLLTISEPVAVQPPPPAASAIPNSPPPFDPIAMTAAPIDDFPVCLQAAHLESPRVHKRRPHRHARHHRKRHHRAARHQRSETT